MPDLTPSQRRRLLDALQASPLFDTREGRDLLLVGLPTSLRGSVARNDTETIDLAHLVDAAIRWGALPNSTSAFLALLDNARNYADNSDAGRALGALYQELAAPAPAAPPVNPPPATLLSSIERAEQYRALRVAQDAGAWERVLELAAGLEGYLDVAARVVTARDTLDRPQHVLEELAKAYAVDEWVVVLRLAQELGAEPPPQVVGWVAQAWRAVSIGVRVFTGHTERVRAVIVTRDGRWVLSGSDDETLRIWDIATGKSVRTLKGHRGAVNAVAVTPDGRLGLSGSGDGTLRLWDLSSGRIVHALTDGNGGVGALAVTPDGQQAISGSKERILRLWDLSSGQPVRPFDGHEGPVFALAVTPNGRQVLSGAWDEMLRLWDLASGQEVRRWAGHTRAVRAVAVTQDGRLALSGSEEGTLWLWNLPSGETVRSLTGHTEGVNAVAVTPDGRLGLSGSDDGTLRLWDLATAQELRTLTGHAGPVFSVAVSPDGRMLVSGGGDKTVRVWTLPEGLLR